MPRKPPGKKKFKAPLKGALKTISPPSQRNLYLVIALVTVFFLVGGYLLYHFQERQMRQRTEDGLSIAAQLKADQITQWRAERLTDANILMSSPFLIEGVSRYKVSPADTELKDEILASLANIEKSYPYQDILLVDANGSVLMSLNDSVHRLSDMTLAQLAIAIEEHKAVMTDFHYPSDGSSPHLDVIAPLFPWRADLQQAIGAVVLCIDPAQYLWPLVQSSPMPGETAETFLVKRDGDQVLFLNELRHQKDAALKLRIPLSQQESPAVMAVQGKEGVVEGKDYRGVEVLAALKHVPDSPWYMVTKIDTGEALSAWLFQAGIIVAFAAGLLAFALAGTWLIWQRRQRLAYQALYQAEIESQALRGHFAYLVKYANDIIILADEDQHVVEANDRALEAYGYTLEEMLGLPMAALIPPGTLSSYRERLRKLQKEGAIVAEGIHQRKDGSTFPVEVSARPLKIEGKQYIQAIIRDITERKRAGEVLRESEERFRAFFEEAPVYHYMVSSEGKILDVNKAALETLGYKREEIIGKPLITTVYAPSSRQKAERLFIKWKETGKIEDEELNIITRRGDERTILLSAHAIRNLEGKALYSISVQRDITERKRAEEALRESEEHYRFLVELSPEAIFVATEGKHVFTNSAGLKLLGASSPDQIVGKPVVEVIHPDYREIVSERMRKAIKTGTAPPVMEEKFVRLDGTVIDVEVKGAPLVYRGKPAMQVFVSDITERKRMEGELRHNMERFKKAMEGVVQVIASIVEVRDPYTAGHQRRVAELACAIAEEMGFSEEGIEEIRMAALVHDIGKIYVPAEILSKPSRLTEIEFSMIKSHPQVAYDILKSVEFPWPIFRLVLQHHEMMNSSGYPGGLRGEDILPGARILAVADVVEAMASHRPYRPALGLEKALDQISQNRGVLYDPEVADACFRVFNEKGFTFE